MSFALLALICLVALSGPALSLPGRLRLPIVIGELLVGIVLGVTGFDLLDPKDATFTFLAEIGFALVLFAAGSSVPLRDPALRSALGRGAGRAIGIGAVAAAAGFGLDAIFHTGHGPLYGVILASSSASVILPSLRGQDLGRPPLSSVIPQIALADAACIVLLPLALEPARAPSAALGSLAVLAIAAVGWLAYRWLVRSGRRRRVERVSESRGLAIELRFLLTALFGLCAVAVMFEVSIMLAGFALGLAVAAVGEPKRLARQVFALERGFFGPIFYVWLGASLDLTALVTHPQSIGLGIALGLSAIAIHALGALTGQPLPVAMMTAAQLGVPLAAATLGMELGVFDEGEQAALLLGALLTIAATAILAPVVRRRSEPLDADGQERAERESAEDADADVEGEPEPDAAEAAEAAGR